LDLGDGPFGPEAALVALPGDGPRLSESGDMARRKRTYKFAWSSKRANHGRRGSRGKVKNWGKKN
jgi:hypothetical protein